MQWYTNIVSDILARSPIPCSTRLGVRGGDYDLTPVCVSCEGSSGVLFIAPFVDPQGNSAPLCDDHVTVYAIVVYDSTADSRGGCQTEDETLAMLYGFITANLRQLGFYVIDHYREIF